MSLSLNNIRTHSKYRLTNFGEIYEFEVVEILMFDDFKLKDIHTMEIYLFSDLIVEGKGKDFSVWKI